MKRSKTGLQKSRSSVSRRWICCLFSALLISTAFPVGLGLCADNLKAMMLYNKALDAYDHKATQEALKLLDEAIKADPGYIDAYYNKGTILYHERQFGQAVKAFRKVAELHPEDSQAYYNLGLCYELDGQKEKAVDAFRKVKPDFSRYDEAQRKITLLRSSRRLSMDEGTSEKTGMKTTEKTGEKAAEQAQPETTPKWGPKKWSRGSSLQTVAKDFEGPTGMAIGANGLLYVADYNRNMIYKLTPEGKKTVFAQGESLKGPIGLVFDSHTNDLYVANYQSNTVIRVNPRGETSILASNVHKPYCLLLDNSRNLLYVSEQETNSVSLIPLGGAGGNH